MSERDWLSEELRAARILRHLKSGECLFRQDNPSIGLYEVAEGKLRLVRVDAAGREAVLHTARAGETIAEASLFSPVYHCDAIAASNAAVWLYPKPAMLAAFHSDPKLAEAFMAMLAGQVMTLRTSLEQRNIRSARDRIRHYFAVNLDRDGRTVRLPGTLKDLAAAIGLTHEAVYRELAAMQAGGEIERLKGKIRLARLAYDRDHK